MSNNREGFRSPWTTRSSGAKHRAERSSYQLRLDSVVADHTVGLELPADIQRGLSAPPCAKYGQESCGKVAMQGAYSHKRGLCRSDRLSPDRCYSPVPVQVA